MLCFAMIEYPLKKSLSTENIHADLVATLGDVASALLAVQEWTTEFRRGGRVLRVTQGPQLPPGKDILVMFSDG